MHFKYMPLSSRSVVSAKINQIFNLYFMSNFKKLSRVEMRSVMAGKFNGCPSCLIPQGCDITNVGERCPGSGDRGGLCAICYCNGSPVYSCEGAGSGTT
jgi:hypothetical protein